MPRIRQQNPQNYQSSAQISAEFENLYRYLNAAELGNKTVGELMGQLFDGDGNFEGPIELRVDTSEGLEYRVGTYADAESGWSSLVPIEDLRGQSGADVGKIGEPVFTSRLTVTGVGGETEIDYAHTAQDDILVYKDGVLLTEVDDYTTSTTGGIDGNGSVLLVAALLAGEEITLFRIRSSDVVGYARTDYAPTASQSVFAFVHSAADRITVYKNGILMQEGGGNDYTTQPLTGTITMNTAVNAGSKLAILAISQTEQSVTGIMLEDAYTDPASGLILFNKLKVTDEEIPQSKIQGLAAKLAEAPSVFIATITPTVEDDGLETGDLWLDTSVVPNQLRYYDGVKFHTTSPESSLPTYSSTDALKSVRVNASGTALEYANVDLSSVIPVTQKGAANGVPTLDSLGRLPASQLPEALSSESISQIEDGAVADGTYHMKRIFKQKVRITDISVRLTSGTATVQIAVNGVGVGDTYSVSSLATEVELVTPIEVDANAASKTIELIVTNAAAANTLDSTLAIANISS